MDLIQLFNQASHIRKNILIDFGAFEEATKVIYLNLSIFWNLFILDFQSSNALLFESIPLKVPFSLVPVEIR